jgi:hypothetical protein
MSLAETGRLRFPGSVADLKTRAILLLEDDMRLRAVEREGRGNGICEALAATEKLPAVARYGHACALK